MTSLEILKEQEEFDWMGSTPATPPMSPEPHLLFTAPENEHPYERKLRMLRQVKNACMACTCCELGRKGVTRDGKLYRDPHVFSSMNPVRFFVLGQNPGWTEVERCEPFVGQAGVNFDQEIRKYGLNRNDFYICNSVRCYTEGNTRPTDRQIRLCEPFLRIEINLIHPLLVIALGSVAFGRLCPGISFNDGLGTVTRSLAYDAPVFAVYHPSPLNLQDMSRKRLFIEQMRVLCKVINRLKASTQVC